MRLLLETFSFRQTANRKPPQFAVTRLQFRVAEISDFSKAFSSVQFSSVQFSSFLFRQNIMQYKNTYRNCKGARETRRLMQPELPILKEIISNKQKKTKRNSRSDKLKIGTKQRLS